MSYACCIWASTVGYENRLKFVLERKVLRKMYGPTLTLTPKGEDQLNYRNDCAEREV